MKYIIRPFLFLISYIFFFCVNSSLTYATCGSWDGARCVIDGQVNFSGQQCSGAVSTCCTDVVECAPVENSQTSPFSGFADSFNRDIGLSLRVQNIPSFLSSLLPYLLVLAGLILFVMLLIGGFQYLTSAGNPKGAEEGKQRISMALAGFVVVFASYWIAQILQVILGVNILK